jgi:hypothetical protein
MSMGIRRFIKMSDCLKYDGIDFHPKDLTALGLDIKSDLASWAAAEKTHNVAAENHFWNDYVADVHLIGTLMDPGHHHG